MQSRVELRIPLPSPSLNKYAFAHWRVQYMDKQAWFSHLLVASRKAKATKATGKRSVTVRRYGRRSLDVDNGYGGLKPILDGMRKLGLILDDDAKSLELRFENCALEKGAEPHTIIEICDV